MDASTPIPDFDFIFETLAVLGHADAPTLATVLGHPPTPEALAAVARHPDVQALNAQWVIAPQAAQAILAKLEQDDLPRYRLLHERALDLMAGRLRAGNQTEELSFVAAFERLGNHLLMTNPEALAQLAAAIQGVPLSPRGQQLRRYFEGLALYMADRYAEALAIFNAMLAEPELDEHVRGRTLNSRANLCRLTGRLEEALTGFRASQELWQQLGDDMRTGLALLNLGIVAYQLQDYGQAERELMRAILLFEATGASHWLASAQNELGLVRRDQGRWAEALANFEAVAAQRRAQNAQDELGRTLNNIGEVLLLQGRLPEAAAAFRESLAAMTTQVYRVDAHLNIGLVQQAQGHLDEARASYQTALDLALEIKRREVLPEAHYRLGEALRRLGEAEAALLHFRAGAEIIEATREPLHDEGLKISLLGRWQQVYEALVLHCLALGQDAEAFDWAERARARAFAEAIGGGEIEKVAATDEVRACLPEGAAMLCYFTTGVLNREIPLVQALSVGNPLREYLLTSARTVLFALTRGRLLAHECSLDPNALASASPRHSDRHQFLTPAILHRLHMALLEPVDDALTAKSLYIIPHGPLHLVPFGALTDSQGRPLIQRTGPVLAYAPSATVLVRHCLAPASARSSPATCLAVGYDGAFAMGEPAALRYTETEAQAVAQLMGGVAWIGPEPKRERLRAAVARQRWLHFACHGQFNYDEPMESYLETGAGEQLTAREILQDWRLPQTELVTLSACQTGVSRFLRSDEPMGLIRAFLSAGARAVLVTQWPVEDLPAFLLIRHFYGELQRGEQASGALRAAQVWLRELTTAQARQVLSEWSRSVPVDEPDPFGNLSPEAQPFGHPRQWAAFILVGA